MTTTMPTRQQIDRAEPLDFPDRRPAKQDLTITISCTIGGFLTEVCFSGQLDQLEAITRRLRDLGASPAGVHQVSPAAAAPTRKAGEKVTPLYNGDGEPMCPVHKRVLKQGKWGMYCSAKGEDETYCNLKFHE